MRSSEFRMTHFPNEKPGRRPDKLPARKRPGTRVIFGPFGQTKPHFLILWLRGLLGARDLRQPCTLVSVSSFRIHPTSCHQAKSGGNQVVFHWLKRVWQGLLRPHRSLQAKLALNTWVNKQDVPQPCSEVRQMKGANTTLTQGSQIP